MKLARSGSSAEGFVGLNQYATLDLPFFGFFSGNLTADSFGDPLVTLLRGP